MNTLVYLKGIDTDELIRRKDVINFLKAWGNDDPIPKLIRGVENIPEGREEIRTELNAKGLTIVKGFRKGEWINDRCSLCNYGVQPWNNTPFCPNCGAYMKEEQAMVNVE